MSRLKKGCSILKKTVIVLAGILFLAIGSYYVGEFAFNAYFDFWGKKLVKLEHQGLLSKEFGAGWNEIIAERAMEIQARRIISDTAAIKRANILKYNGITADDYPSLSVIARLNEVGRYANTISIVDRNDRPIATIRTNHDRVDIKEVPQTLIKALIAAEDGNFYVNKRGVEFTAFFRAILRAIWGDAVHFRLRYPQGTSTITQQVAKLFISRLDFSGRRRVSRSIDRKLREMRLASALRRLYSSDEILDVYVNHCITGDYGLVGVKDISEGLFGKKLSELSDAQCVYMARMVKWGRNVPKKIEGQCSVDMPRIGAALGWDLHKQSAVLLEIHALTFEKPRRINTNYGPLVDLANEYWLLILRRKGLTETQIADMDLINPNSLVRRKGSCTIKLSIDLPLQRQLERLVDARGYGRDTSIVADVRIGSNRSVVFSLKPPQEVIRAVSVVRTSEKFSEPGSSFIVNLDEGDTLITDMRYKKIGLGRFRKSSYFYTRRAMTVSGQYFAYAAMDSRTGKLLAYYSRDKIGSRLACLLKNRVPNGSSTAKPVFNALNFDIGNFKPYSKWTDSVEVTANVPWKRSLEAKSGKTIGVVFAKSAVPGVGYEVHNHGFIFEGCRYIFDLLASSNNILGVESVYRLNRTLFDSLGAMRPEAEGLAHLFYRLGDFERIKDSLHLKTVTGVRAYKELARIVGVDIDSITSDGKRIPVSDSMYSAGLGTLELTLLEQLHVYNMLYNNDLIERPADHPSLVVESIILNGDSVVIDDTVRHFHPFSDVNNLRPTWLGMHKRLVSNPTDGLREFDVSDTLLWLNAPTIGTFNNQTLMVSGPVANYAKSGTSDDVIRPFNVGNESDKRANYGLWNAVLRLDFMRLSNDSADAGIHDITLACVGECNQRFTGERDGKSLHKFVSIGLLKKAGIPVDNGFFNRYEAYLKNISSDSNNACGNGLTGTLETQE